MELIITCYDWNGIIYTDSDNIIYMDFNIKVGEQPKENILVKLGKYDG